VTPVLSVTWSEPANSGAVSFANATSLSTTATFTAAGSYVLKLTVSDSASGTVTISVGTENPSQIIRRFYSLGGMAVATRTLTDYPTLTDTDELQWLAGDHLGSVTGVGNQDLSSAYKAWYYPYCTVRGETGATGIDQSFTGQTNNPGTGLIDYNARQYDPLIGRFIQADSIVPSPKLSSDLNR
jgi:RHS repeat-associated protein